MNHRPPRCKGVRRGARGGTDDKSVTLHHLKERVRGGEGRERVLTQEAYDSSRNHTQNPTSPSTHRDEGLVTVALQLGEKRGHAPVDDDLAARAP